MAVEDEMASTFKSFKGLIDKMPSPALPVIPIPIRGVGEDPEENPRSQASLQADLASEDGFRGWL